MWEVWFFSDANGREPVRLWLEELERAHPGDCGRVRHHIDLLEEFGPLLSEPHSRQLRGKLRELRPGKWRVTYFADPKRRMILLSSFRKTSRRTPPTEIARAEKPMRAWLRRNENEK
ncbi:MAG: addiction module toxin RelE [Acidobacteria bacterium]|nr:MAG: addiction module toxin RelE [Acidobacteriota bacterium]